MPDVEQIDPTVDRVWAVDGTVSFTSYVIAETADEAERIAENEEGELRYTARELTTPLDRHDPDRDTVPYGRSCWDGSDLTVNEAVELLMPVYDRLTLLMPFADAPPPLHPPRIEAYLAAGSAAR